MALKLAKKSVRKIAKTPAKNILSVKKTSAVSAKKKVIKKAPPGYEKNESGLLTPNGISKPIPASKLRIGFKKAKKEINSIIDEIASTMTDNIHY